MAQDNQQEENDDIMTQIEKKQMELILLEKAFENAWYILSGQISFDELIGHSFSNNEQMIMAFDPDNGPKAQELKNMIQHWADKEEYERCAELTSILHNMYPESIKE
jgi:hypothetical protein